MVMWVAVMLWFTVVAAAAVACALTPAVAAVFDKSPALGPALIAEDVVSIASARLNQHPDGDRPDRASFQDDLGIVRHIGLQRLGNIHQRPDIDSLSGLKCCARRGELDRDRYSLAQCVEPGAYFECDYGLPWAVVFYEERNDASLADLRLDPDVGRGMQPAGVAMACLFIAVAATTMLSVAASAGYP